MNHEQIRQQVAKTYKSRISELEAEVDKYKNLYLASQIKVEAFEKSLNEATKQIRQLQELLQLSPEQFDALRFTSDNLTQFFGLIDTVKQVYDYV